MDESKSCAASVNFRAETFARYACDETCAALVGGRAQRGGARAVAFDVNLGALIDALGAFGRGDGELVARWPNREGMLTLELESAEWTGGGERFETVRVRGDRAGDGAGGRGTRG